MKRVIIITVLLALAGCSLKSTPEVAELKAGDSLPDFSVLTNTQDIISTGNFNEGYGFIVFFNTACPDCQEELPTVQNLYQSYGDIVIFLAISRGEKDDSIGKYWKDNNLTFPYSAQDDNSVFNLFAPHTIPRSFLVKDGIIIASWDDSPVMQEENFTKYM